MSGSKPHLPSPGRLSAARRAGLIPDSPLFGQGVVLLFISLSLHLLSPIIVRMLERMWTQLLSGNIHAVAVGRTLPGLIWPIVLLLLLPLGAVLGVTVVIIFRRGTGRGYTNNPLPDKVTSHGANWGVAAGVAVCVILFALWRIRDAGFTYQEMLDCPTSVLGRLFLLGRDLLLSNGFLMLLFALIHQSLKRRRFLAALSLDNGEQRREARLSQRRRS